MANFGQSAKGGPFAKIWSLCMEIFRSEIFLGLVNGRENVQIHRPGVRFKEAF